MAGGQGDRCKSPRRQPPHPQLGLLSPVPSPEPAGVTPGPSVLLRAPPLRACPCLAARSALLHPSVPELSSPQSHQALLPLLPDVSCHGPADSDLFLKGLY